jgi:putative DNA primase/helicase
VHDESDDEILTDEEIQDAQSQRTDAANADAVAAACPNVFRYVTEWEAWITWDGARWHLPGGKHGAKDAVLQSILRVMRLRYIDAKARLQALAEEELVMLTDGRKGSDEHESNLLAQKFHASLVKWFEQSQNAAKLGACEALLRGKFAVGYAKLDAHPWLLNVLNGTIDLRTGELLPHDRGELLTQVTAIEYDPDAKCPTWRAFLSTAMRDSAIMTLFLQRLVGYTLTGTTQEHVLVFHYGHTGSNGKSTFLATIRTLMGEYACTAPRTLLFEPRAGAEPHPTELARLYAKRLATCAEVPEGVELAEAKVKDLTGGDVISVRRMSENFWDLTPTHTLHAAGNHKPTIRGTDGGIWRRVKLVPWTVEIAVEHQDKELGAKLRAELPGILAWAVEGCLEWLRCGLAEPDEVKVASKEYRVESDVLGAFLDAHCVFGPVERSTCKQVRASYERWCEEMGHKPVGARTLARRLRERGAADAMVRGDGRPVHGWAGVRLREAHEYALVEGTLQPN